MVLLGELPLGDRFCARSDVVVSIGVVLVTGGWHRCVRMAISILRVQGAVAITRSHSRPCWRMRENILIGLRNEG